MPALSPSLPSPGARPGARPGAPSGRGRPRRFAAVAGVLLASLAAGACSEDLETTAVCVDASELCPEQRIEVEQVVLNPVTFDTSLTGVPLLGNEPWLALTLRGDTLETRAVVRFDELPTKYLPGTGADSAAITEVVNPVVQLVLDRRVSAFDGPVTVEAYDVTHAGSDTSTAEVLPLFTAERRLGALDVTPRPATDTVTFDTLRVPLDPARLLAKVTGEERLRIGLRITNTERARLLVTHGASLRFRPVADTTVQAISIAPQSATPVDDAALRTDLRSYMIVAAGSPPPAGPVLSVGGFPSRRSYLRFSIPEQEIPVGARIVRATLVLTQRPVAGFAATDTLTLRALPVTASRVVTDLDRLVRLAANPGDGRGGEVSLVAPKPLVPGDSGAVELTVANLVTLWSENSGIDIQPALVLAVEFEGTSPLRAEFFSTDAAPELRPQLRVSFVRSVNFDLP